MEGLSGFLHKVPHFSVLKTHVDVLQVQEVQDDAVPLPDDWRAQRPLDGTCEDGAETHRYRGDADPLLLRQAELHDLCDEE